MFWPFEGNQAVLGKSAQIFKMSFSCEQIVHQINFHFPFRNLTILLCKCFDFVIINSKNPTTVSDKICNGRKKYSVV